ncbi:MAG: DinB family protein [Candidatus Dormibacteraeota bacterium]|nr:DinB family protein [Candidatus Dormibacteraeota bacterium]
MPLPPLAAEDHVCGLCGFSFAALGVEEARSLIEVLPERYRSAVAGMPDGALRRRPAPGVWSPIEYLCHVRDVYVSHLVRLYRSRTEEDPGVEPMFNDLRARRLHYDERDAGATLDELEAAVAGLLEESRRFQPDQWARTVHRLPGESRTARWLLRNAAHEGIHHLRDLSSPAA